MTVREYIGARYVPLFADPIEWDNTKTYEPLTIVYYQGNSYTSKTSVPAGIEITNTTYWALTGNYNAQIEAYRHEVETFDGRITENANAIDSLETDVDGISDDITDINSNITTINANDWVTTTRVNDSAITTGKLNNGAVTTVKIADENVTEAKLADDSVTTDKIADENVTEAKLADDSVTTDKIADETITKDKLHPSVLKKPYFYVCGDSFSVSNRQWVGYFESMVGKTAINKATSSASFTKGTGATSIVEQFRSVCNDPHLREAEYIIIYGGVNDFANTPATTASMQSALSTIKTLYDAISGDKPKLYLCLGNAPYGGIGWAENYPYWVNQCNDIAIRMKFPNVIDNVVSWLLGLGNTAVFDNDLLHPNSNGAYYIAQFMYKIVNGTYDGVHRTLNIPHQCESGYIVCEINNNMIDYSYYLHLTSAQVTAQQSNEYTRVSIDMTNGVAFANPSGHAVDELMKDGSASSIAINAAGGVAIQCGTINMAFGNLYIHSRGARNLMNYSILMGNVTIPIAPWTKTIS